MTDGRRISDEEAREIWRRAVRLQGAAELLALAERRLTDWEAIRPERLTTRWLRRLVGDADALEVTRFVRGSPSRVLDAIEHVTGDGEFKLVAEGRG